MKNNIKKLFNFLGVDIKFYDPTKTPFSIFMPALKHFNIDQVLDVGANAGYFGQHLRKSGYQGKIVSFEPLESVYGSLVENSKGDDNWLVHPRCAVGAEIGSIDINVSENSVSSSILSMLDAHLASAPNSAYVSTEACDLITLDSIQAKYLNDNKRTLVKIDTQGYESQVLDGGSNAFSQVQGVLIEMSIIPLYEGQVLWEEILQRLESMGFTLWTIQPAFEDKNNGRTLQLDGLFFRL